MFSWRKTFHSQQTSESPSILTLRYNSFIQCPANGSHNFHPLSQRQKVYTIVAPAFLPGSRTSSSPWYSKKTIPVVPKRQFHDDRFAEVCTLPENQHFPNKKTSSKGIVHPATIDFQGTFVSFPAGVGLLKLVSWLFQESCARLLEKTMVDYSSSLRPINV